MSQAISGAGFGAQPERYRIVGATDPVYQAYQALHLAFTAIPIVAGVDKFLHLLVNWNQYLSPFYRGIVHNHVDALMHAVGIVEIIAGLGVLFMPRFFAWIVAAWLVGIIVNLILLPPAWGMPTYDIALRDLGLCMCAIALARLSSAVHARRAL